MRKISGIRHILFLILFAAVLAAASAFLYWKHLDADIAQAHLPQKQVMVVVFMCAAIVIVLGVLVAFIMQAYRRYGAELYRAGFIDELTGLGNQNYFQSNLAAYGAAFRKSGAPFALAAVNIKNFKAINDIYGFEEGDKILKRAARAMREEVKNNELLCRLNADRFLLLLACPERGDFEARIAKILSRVSNACKGAGVAIIANAGVYAAGDDIPFYIMADRANMALKTARKSAGRAAFAFYHDEDRERMDRIASIESRMHAALAEGQFKVYFQPKYNFKTGRIESAEALVRWQDPQKGLVPPDDFIPVFEKNGFVLKLDKFILEETVKFLARRREEGRRVVPVGVNFSRLHLDEPGFIDSVTEIVDKYKLPHELIEIEITESIAFHKGDIMRGVLEGFHGRGFSVAMDDFGSGYSSLNILKDLYFDCVKLDKEFLANAQSSERMRHIISSAVGMIKKLGCLIVTEGVETKEQAAFLRGIGCDLAQGYLYSRPLLPAEFEKFLDEDAAKTDI